MEAIGNRHHVAGIVPVASQPLDFEFDWSDCLMPIAPNYTAVEKAVVECAWAGCKTIWIICNDDVTPLVRHRIGDYIQDPIWLGRKFDRFPSASRKPISIFYVPIHPKDRNKRDCLSWSIVHGALTAYKTCSILSRWVAPKRYYVSFPYGMYPVEILREHRNAIQDEKNFLLMHNGKTVRDGEYAGFTFNAKDWLEFRRNVREGTGIKMPGSDYKDNEYLPIQERFSARFFTLDRIFNCVNIEGSKVVELPWYYNIDNWESYCQFLGSEERKQIKRPHKLILSYREFNPIGVDNE